MYRHMKMMCIFKFHKKGHIPPVWYPAFCTLYLEHLFLLIKRHASESSFFQRWVYVWWDFIWMRTYMELLDVSIKKVSFWFHHHQSLGFLLQYALFLKKTTWKVKHFKYWLSYYRGKPSVIPLNKEFIIFFFLQSNVIPWGVGARHSSFALRRKTLL